jgi:thioredoxin reductase (NADPH)
MGMTKTLYDVAVIGSGGAGQMAMLRAVLNHLKTVVFLGDSNTTRRSRATWVVDVENIPGLFDKKRPITMTTKETVQFIESHADLKPYLMIIKQAAAHIKKENHYFVISTRDQNVKARFIVLCMGTMDVQPEIGGSIEPIFPYANRGDVYYCVRCDGHKTAGKSCAVIGYREGAGHMALLLKERYDLPKLYILGHGHGFEGKDETKILLQRYHIETIESEIVSIVGDAKKGLAGFKLKDGRQIEVEKAFVAMGSIVYNDLAKQLGVKLDHREHLIVDEDGQTSVDGVYAAGDLVSDKKKQVYTAWDLAVDAVDAIDGRVRLQRRQKRFQN